MPYEFDPKKDTTNLANHQGVSLVDAEGFEWDTCVVREDARHSYAERRFEAVGYIGLRLHVMVFCNREQAVRVISLRRANKREESRYAKT